MLILRAKTDRLAFAIFDTAQDENSIVRRKVSCTHDVNQTFARTPRQLLLATHGRLATVDVAMSAAGGLQ